MNLTRLKFAYARGARIEAKVLGYRPNGKNIWVPAGVVQDDSSIYRVHPDDAHLEYGPLSTALRNRVLDRTYQTTHWNTPALAAANAAFHYEIGKDYGGKVDDDYHMAMLLYAELLADEGL